MKKLRDLFSKRRIIIISFIALAVVGYFLSRSAPESPFETAVVLRGDVVQEVSITGRVLSEKDVVLSFERGGRVSTVPLPVGTRVSPGATLVRLDTAELVTLRTQAQANLDAESARLSELKQGTREEDIAVSRAQLESTQSSLAQARIALLDRVYASWVTSDDAIRNVADKFFRNPRTRNPELTLPVTDARLAITLPQERVMIEDILSDWQSDIVSWNSLSDMQVPIERSSARIEEIKSFMDTLALATNGLTPSTALPQATIDSWKSGVSAARSSVASTFAALLSAAERYHSTNEAVKVAEQQLILKMAGPTEDAIRAQEARIAAARAAIANYDTQIAKMTLVAPFSGVITTQEAKQGQYVAPGVPLVTMMSAGNWKIEANIPEVDVAKVKVGDPAVVSFDAYGQDVLFEAQVATIDPAETIVAGVSTYKVSLVLLRDDERVRSGMTANIDIRTDERKDVLRVPVRAVATTESGRSVRVPSPDGLSATVVPVELGLRGSDGFVEVLSGLSTGDRVVIYEKK